MATYLGSAESEYIIYDELDSTVEIVGSTLPPQHNVYDYLYGGDGSDELDGGRGADYMDGGSSWDVYWVDHAGDVVFEENDDALSGNDTVMALISYTLPSMIENLRLEWGTTATGNAKDNILRGNELANVLNGMAGADTMDAGGGNDTYYVDNVLDVVHERVGYYPLYPGVDTVFSTVTYTLDSTIEHLTLQGGASINATGNGKDNLLVGNKGANVLSGKGGADRLNGGAGDDVFDFNRVEESNASVRDQIMSFEFGPRYGTSTTGDRIDVSGIDANLSLSGNQAFKWGGTVTQSKGYLWAENAGGGRTTIKGNVDDDAEAEFHVSVSDGVIAPMDWIAGDFIL